MVLTVTINPLLERRYEYQKVSLHHQNRNGVVTLQAGGKGINVSRQLNELNVQNIALTFLGGANGKAFREAINKDLVNRYQSGKIQLTERGKLYAIEYKIVDA